MTFRFLNTTGSGYETTEEFQRGDTVGDFLSQQGIDTEGLLIRVNGVKTDGSHELNANDRLTITVTNQKVGS